MTYTLKSTPRKDKIPVLSLPQHLLQIPCNLNLSLQNNVLPMSYPGMSHVTGLLFLLFPHCLLSVTPCSSHPHSCSDTGLLLQLPRCQTVNTLHTSKILDLTNSITTSLTTFTLTITKHHIHRLTDRKGGYQGDR